MMQSDNRKTHSSKVCNILYSGLGGQGNVFMSYIAGWKNSKLELQQYAIFYGVEELVTDYAQHCKNSEITFSYISKRRGLDLRSAYRVYKKLKQYNPDIVQLHAILLIFPVWFYCRTHNKKLIVIEHQANLLKGKLEWVWTRVSLKRSNYLIYLTEEYLDEIKVKFGKRFPEKKVRIIANGIDLGGYVEEIKGINRASFTIGMVSRLVRIKDQFTLIDAMELISKKYTGAKLIIIGDGEIRNELIQYVNKKGLAEKVKFMGIISDEQVKEVLKIMDIYMHATFGETLSTAIIQAMAAAKPIIASDVKGVNNMLQQNYSAVLVPVRSPVKILEAVVKIVENREFAELIVSNTRKMAFLKYDADKMFLNYAALY